MLKLIGQIGCALGKATGVCEIKEEIPKVSPLITISRTEFLNVFILSGISSMAILDSKLTITSKSELDRIAPYLVYPANNYVEDIWDCEDYGLQGQVDAGHKFGVSGVRLGLGWMPLGYHGFLLTIDKDKNIWWLEPNAGFDYAGVWYKIGDKGYKPNKILA